MKKKIGKKFAVNIWLSKNFILYDNWYFVLSYNIEKAFGFRFLFNSLIKFRLQKKHYNYKHKETEIDDNDSRQLSLILKSFVPIRENENFVVKTDFEKNEIWFEYYYDDNDDFSSEKEINYLNRFLKLAHFNQKSGL